MVCIFCYGLSRPLGRKIIDKGFLHLQGINAIYQGIANKIEVINTISDDLSRVAYIGDDINDLMCMKYIKAAGGIVGCPADASDEVKMLSDFISNKNGGDGAVRE